jgi:hypothetical protein
MDITPAPKMPKWKRHLCQVILYLDLIPRYGRIYTVDIETHKIYPPHWEFQKHGHWGISVLDKIGWFWPFVNESIGDLPEDDD